MNKDEEMIYRSIPEAEMIELSENYMCLYGINVNLQRAIPFVSDGMKPVWRKILFALYKNYNKNKVKVASLQGDVLKLHPHSELGMKDIIARLAQPFSNNKPYLTPYGNCGTATVGDDAAAGRYWEVALSPFALDVLFSEFDGKVNMTWNYDETILEPIFLPAKFPIILLNGISGIGYTLSTDVYPHNLCEVADATIKLLKNPSAKIRLVPDSPTGCDIIIRDEESFIMQSSFDVDNVNYVITIKNTPYMKYLNDIDNKLREIQDSPNPIKEILSADDESDLIAGEIKYVIRCKPCNLYNVINTLFKRVPGFRFAVSARNMLVVDGFRNRKYDARQILCSWIKNRLKEKRSWFLRELVAYNKDYNMLEGKAFMLSPENLNKTIKIFRECAEDGDIIEALVEAYKDKVTTSQAHYVSELKLRRINLSEYNKTLKDIEKIKSEIEYIRGVVDDPEKIRDVIIDEIKTIKQKYGTPRKSKIINLTDQNVANIGIIQLMLDGTIMFSETENPEQTASDIIPISGDKVCLIDDKARFLWIDVNRVPHDKPLTLTSIGKTQMSKCVFGVSNENNDLVILTNQGRMKYMPISRIPSNASRKPLVQLNEDEYIVCAMELNDNSSDILIYTSDGMGKRIQTTDLNKSLSVDAAGQFILKGYDVRGMFCVNSNKPLLVYVTRLGRMRVNHSKFLTSTKKYAEPKPIIKLSQQDDLIAVFCCTNEQSVTLNHADGRVTTVHIDSLDVSTMAMEPKRPRHIPGVKVLRGTLS